MKDESHAGAIDRAAGTAGWRASALAGLLVAHAALGALAIGTGCGATTAVAIVVGIGASDSGSDDPAAPAVEAPLELRREDLVGADGLADAAEIAIAYRLVDPTGAAIDLDARWRLASEAESVARPATEAAGSDGVAGLAASPPPGATHRFVWAAAADLDQALGVEEADVVLTLQPRRQGAPGAPRPIRLRAGNRAPLVLLDAAAGALTRTALTRGTVEDPAADPILLRLEVREAGSAGAPVAVPNLLTDGGATVLIGAAGQSRVNVAWDTLAAFGVRDLEVELALVAIDLFGATATATATALVDNDEPPSAQLIAVGTATGIASVDGRVPIRFALFDQDAALDPTGPSGLPDARVEVSIDGGQSFQAITPLAIVNEHGAQLGLAATRALAARPFPEGVEGRGPNVHTVLWDARADGLGGGGARNALVRVTPVAAGQDGQGDQSPVRLGEAVELFEEVARFASGGRPEGVHLADLDLDGALDLVVEVGARGAEGSVATVRLGDGRGGFGADADALTLPIRGSVSVGDLSGDGVPDLFESGGGGGFGLFFVWVGSGDGTFAQLDHDNDGNPAITPSIAFPTRAALADLDGDGRLDLVLGHVFFQGVDVRFGTDAPPFFEILAAPVTMPLAGQVSGTTTRVGDVDGDGVLDIVATDGGGGLAIHRGLGGRVFAPEVAILDAANTKSLALADLDEDGRADLVLFEGGEIGQVTDAVEVRAGRPAPDLLAAPVAIREVGYEGAALADVDQDGHQDLLLGTVVPSELRVRFGDGAGGFGQGFGTALGLFVISGAIGDVDADGVLDVVAGTDASGGSVTVRLGRGGGLSPEPALTPAGFAALADLDQDGHLDLATAAFEATVRRGDGVAGFEVASAVALSPARAAGIAAADLDQDGRPDLAVSAGEPDTETSTVTVVRGAAGPGLVAAPSPPVAVDARAGHLALLDADQDGARDALLTASGKIALLLGAPAASPPLVAGPPPALASITGSAPPGQGDEDGDGAPDLVATAGISNSRFGAFLVAASPGPPPAPPEPPLVSRGFVTLGTLAFRVTLADLDEDGHLDVLAGDLGNTGASLSAGAVVIRRGLGLGLLAPPRALAAGPVLEVEVADVDGDGAADLVAWQPVANDLSLLRRTRALGLVPQGTARRGDGRPFALHLARTPSRVQELGNLGLGLQLADLSGDGVADVLLPGDPLQVLVAAVTAGSRVDPALGAAQPSGVAVRRAPAPRLAAALLAGGPSAGALLRPISDAVVLAPEGEALATPAPLTLELRTSLTAAELATGVLRILREDRGLASGPAAGIDPATGAVRFRTVVEVGRRDPGDPSASFPAGLVLDPVRGTLTLPIDRLGRYQAFLEAPLGTAVLVRETFDAPTLASLASPLRPFGWTGSGIWATGQAAAALADRPPPASAPCLFGVGLHGPYGPALDATARSAFVETPRPPAGRRIVLRWLRWHELGLGDRVELALVARAADGSEARALVTTYEGASDLVPTATPVLEPEVLEAEVAAALTAAFDALAAGGDDASEGAAVAVELRFVSDAADSGRGFFCDDLELVVEDAP